MRIRLRKSVFNSRRYVWAYAWEYYEALSYWNKDKEDTRDLSYLKRKA